MEHKIYNRETLYKEVWEEPMTEVAKRYGVSNVALKKTCRKLQIPTPGNGYWAQVRSGYSIEIPPLPIYDGSQEEKKERKLPKDPNYEKVKNAYESIINDTEAISTYHRYVLIAEKALRKQETSPYNPFKKAFDITVTDSSLDRILKIVNIVFRTLLKLKYKIDFDPKYINSNTIVIVENERIRIRFKEFAKMVSHVPTAAEKKDRYSYMPKYDFLPTNSIALIISEPGRSYGKECTLRDSDKYLVESCIVRFILKLIDFALWIKQDRKEREIRQEENKRRMIELENQKRLEREELDRFKGLETDAMDWYSAQIIKDYVDSVEIKMRVSRLSPEEIFERKKWIKWARGKIDWLNPAINKEDPILGKRRKKSMFNIDDQNFT